MLLHFAVSNYRCFHKYQALTWTADLGEETLPENSLLLTLPGLENKRLLKGMAVYGANASGKSTLISALRALKAMVTESAKTVDAEDPITQVEPFALASDTADEPTGFAVVFIAEAVRYEYRVAATQSRIWHESLRAFPTGEEQVWFCREWQEEDEQYLWMPEQPIGFERDTRLEGYTLKNVLFLSKAIANNCKTLEPVYRWFKNNLRFLDLTDFIGEGFTLKQLAKKTVLMPRILDILSHADVGIMDARIIETEKPSPEQIAQFEVFLSPELKEKLSQGGLLEPELLHQGHEAASYALPWKNESEGTRRFFALAGPWLDILQNGYTVCIDELENSLHPILVNALLKLLFSKEHNPKGAQVLFATHNPTLLDMGLLRRDQVWFTEKDTQGESHLYSLIDFHLQKDESLLRGYLSGRYGAIPFIPAGLMETDFLKKYKTDESTHV